VQGGYRRIGITEPAV